MLEFVLLIGFLWLLSIPFKLLAKINRDHIKSVTENLPGRAVSEEYKEIDRIIISHLNYNYIFTDSKAVYEAVLKIADILTDDVLAMHIWPQLREQETNMCKLDALTVAYVEYRMLQKKYDAGQEEIDAGLRAFKNHWVRIYNMGKRRMLDVPESYEVFYSRLNIYFETEGSGAIFLMPSTIENIAIYLEFALNGPWKDITDWSLYKGDPQIINEIKEHVKASIMKNTDELHQCWSIMQSYCKATYSIDN